MRGFLLCLRLVFLLSYKGCLLEWWILAPSLWPCVFLFGFPLDSSLRSFSFVSHWSPVWGLAGMKELVSCFPFFACRFYPIPFFLCVESLSRCWGLPISSRIFFCLNSIASFCWCLLEKQDFSVVYRMFVLSPTYISIFFYPFLVFPLCLLAGLSGMKDFVLVFVFHSDVFRVSPIPFFCLLPPC